MQATKADRTSEPAGKPRSIWDNDLPPGDAPPLPRWPLTVSIAVYVVWMVFLVSMMILRLVQVS